MIAASDGAKLITRLGDQRRALRLARDRAPDGRLEEWMIGWRIVVAIAAADAEADRRLDLVGEVLELLAREAIEGEIGANRGVAARDVESDADHRDLASIGGDTTDRHHVADVSVGHQCNALGAGRDVRELGERLLLVSTEDHAACHPERSEGSGALARTRSNLI